MLKILRLLMLIGSMCGYMFMLRGRIRSEFSLAFLFSCIASAMVIAGMLNILNEAAWLIFIGGILCLIVTVIKWLKANKENNISVVFRQITGKLSFELIFFAASSLLLLLGIYGRKFVHYDNFSHWALALRSIIANDSFPNFQDHLILFPQYPLGSAGFIYYVVNIAGLDSEWLQMYAQAILMLGLSMGLFCFARKVENKLFTALAILILLCSNISFSDLLVDTLLPLCALSAFGLSVYLCTGKYEGRAFYQLIPMLLLLVSIKNSGLLFFAFVLVYLAKYMLLEKRAYKEFAVLSASPALLCWLWQKHVDQVFYNGLDTKHSINAGHLQAVFSEKSAENIAHISKAMLEKCFSVENSFLFILVVLIALWIAVTYFKRDKAYTRSLLVLMFVYYIVYQLGTLLMYLFSMPVGEAMYLAEYDRYHKTVLIYLAGMLVMMANLIFSGDSAAVRTLSLAAKRSCALAVLLLLSIGALRPDFSNYGRQRLEGSRHKLESLVTQYKVLPGYSYYIVLDDASKDSGYLYVFSRYLLQTNSNDIEKTSSFIQKDSFEGYDYLILADANEEAMDRVEDVFHCRERVICLWEYME